MLRLSLASLVTMIGRAPAFATWILLFGASALIGIAALEGHCLAQSTPHRVSYQGELLRDGSPFTGTAQFKFLLYDDDDDNAFWSNDGSSQNASEEPESSVSVVVEDGIFSVILGDPPMIEIPPDGLATNGRAVLRIWVRTGSSFEQLPDQQLASSAYALYSENADGSVGPFTADGVVWSVSGGFKFPDGTLQTTAATGGGGGGGTLDQAYDFGGPGAGRTITADAGAVSVQGPDGLRVGGSIGVGTTSTPFSRLSIENVGGSNNVKLLSFDEAQGGEFHLEGDFAGSGDTGNELSLNSAWSDAVQVWRGDGHVAFGARPGGARVSVFHNATGSANPALFAWNPNTGDSHGLYALTWGTGPAASFLSINGDNVRFLNPSGSTVGRVDNSGRGYFAALQNNSGSSVLDTSGRWRMSGAFGGGVGGAPIFAENTTSNGVALWGKVTGTDATAVLEQNGTGDILKGFKSGVNKFRVTNTGRVVTTALEITGGGDLAEPFTVSGEQPAEPGSVLVIDSEHPGQLTLSTRAYDRKVVGIVSGAGGIQPGITLTPGDHQLGGQHVALSGRVFAKADASNGPIEPGDLLTTSDVAGHVMKVTNPGRANGAVIGKAMTVLEKGRGLVLVFVTLQ